MYVFNFEKYKFNYDKDVYVSPSDNESGKEIYYKFLEYAVKRCVKFVLTIWDFKNKEYNPREHFVIKALEPYLIKLEKLEPDEDEKDLFESDREDYLYYYRCCEEVIPILKSVSEGFYHWGSNNCPFEDLTFLLENNEVWYISTTHESEFDLYMDKNEYDIFKKEVEGLELINTYEADMESMLVYHEDPGKEVYIKALKYAENRSNYFNFEIFTVLEEANGYDIIQESLRKYNLIDELSQYKINSESKLLKNFPVEMEGFPKGELNGVVTFGGYDVKNYDKNFLSKIEEDALFESEEDEEEFKEAKIVFKDVYHTILKYKLNDQSIKVIENAAENMFCWGHKNKMPDVVRFYEEDTENTCLVLCANDGFKTSYVRFKKYGELVRFGKSTNDKGECHRL